MNGLINYSTMASLLYIIKNYKKYLWKHKICELEIIAQIYNDLGPSMSHACQKIFKVVKNQSRNEKNPFTCDSKF